ncbi:MAG: FlgD immunoglobulin-like domain containing protein, partial [Candidatus Eisenbacteria bacterium]
ARYVGNQSRLHWLRSPAADFLEFRIYRGDNPNFVADWVSFVVGTPDTQFVESAPPGTFYKLVAADRHGNLSITVWVQAEVTLDAPAATPRLLAFARPEPNPSRGRTALRFSLPAAGRVVLELFDEKGRRVRTLLAGELPAGEHSRVWDGRDDAGSATAPGIYFARLSAQGETKLQRLTRVN